MNYTATVISNLSNGYIHLYWTSPPTFTSYGTCIGRCSIESKNDGGCCNPFLGPRTKKKKNINI